MMVGLLATLLGLGGIVATCLLVRTVNRQAEETFDAIVTSPANEAETAEPSRVVVGTVLALDEEMLIELQTVKRGGGDGASILWVHGPTNVTSIITLTRWRDSCSIVAMEQQPRSVVLSDDQTRVRLTAARADLAV